MADRPEVTRRDIEARLIAQAWKDEAFATDLRRDPRAAIAAELAKLGIEAQLADNLEVKVLEETSTSLYLVIPQRPSQEGLSDEQIDQAVGGLDAATRFGFPAGTLVLPFNPWHTTPT